MSDMSDTAEYWQDIRAHHARRGHPLRSKIKKVKGKNMAKKQEVKKAEVKPQSVFTVSEISPKGIKAIFGGVRLNWVFLATPKPDKPDEKTGLVLKAQYRTQAILGNGEKEFIAGLRKACEQYMQSASIAWGGEVRTKILKHMFTIDVDKGFFKSTEHGYAINTHSAVMREAETDPFVAKYPPKLILENGEAPATVAEAEKAFYSGMYADLAVWIQAYDKGGGRGLSVYLNGVRKLADGEQIAGSVNPFEGTTPTTLPAPLKAKALL